MHLVLVLQAALLALVFAAPALAIPTTPYDPFHDLAVFAPKPPELPICCLKPLTPLEPVEEEPFLSFEEWKTKRHMEKDAAAVPSRASSGGPTSESAAEASSHDASPSPVAGTQDVADQAHPPSELLSPHFRVPLTDRFNYASLDCSARVHTAHREAKSAANILSSKRDRYMLSPCAFDLQFVVVELCEDIQIDTVQMANFEFFSGVFKEFTVSVAKTYMTEPDGWTVVGTYVGKNVRGVQVRELIVGNGLCTNLPQSFHPPTSIRDFYRFIRIDFHSHYGNEYYCPISLLRVYGLTHLEQWKWDIWEAESRAKLEQSVPVEVSDTPAAEHVMVESWTSTTNVTEAADRAEYTVHIPVSSPSTYAPHSEATHVVDVGDTQSSTGYTGDTNSSTTTDNTASSVPPPLSSDSPASESLSSSIASSPTSIISLSASTVVSLPPPSAPTHIASSGESIYRTIMNRLTALEANTTLYARYVEEQTGGIREVLRRLGEDVGRLEGIGKAQAVVYQRSMHDFEKQRRRMEVEQRELLTRVNYLADEIVLEKRLGIAQLCLLLAVLVFLSLTRGSRTEHIEPASVLNNVPGGMSVREWGRRNLSFSGDWVSRFKSRSRSLTPSPGEATPLGMAGRSGSGIPPSSTPSNDEYADNLFSIAIGDKVTFPSHEPPASEKYRHPKSFAVPRRPPPSRPRTPSTRTPRHYNTYHYHRPATPTRARPPMPLASSYSMGAVSSSASGSTLVGPVPRSAKRWARSAHLHEVRKGGMRDMEVQVQVRDGEAEVDDGPFGLRRDVDLGYGFDAADGVKSSPMYMSRSVDRYRRRASPLRDRGVGDGDGGGDVWVDTDADGSEMDWAARHIGEVAVVGS
ncbi:hypothetical protein EW146_g8646 [Bondarzewia mesenterica]|uniref:SUN domain-containing protein n=1 Tax=Bondarzewia mesenterica TaxID=1095465 RepID=A0A4S4LCT3_9AGAM|nr:hypothetical protein EW146_g8646 [Bondarzewia mesenterica]